MRRADRLFEIIQLLRRATEPVTAARIADELETSKRTIYRDIDALIGQRVPIRGEAGIGYVLERGFDLPPLMLTADEVEAVALGAQWVVVHGDDALARAALDVLAKVAVIVPEAMRDLIADPAVGTPPKRARVDDHVDVARLRLWCREGRVLEIGYRDESGRISKRTIRPFMVGYVEDVRVIASWCELRQDFRVFRTDRLTAVDYLERRYPDHPVALRRKWLRLMRYKRALPNSGVSP
ncbi:helix-turn-helix transcriptional regulator [Sphingomonas sp. GB1N7]|uniref:helix-turn-helix transcriptional regulator n=1 Tax=Parasphingomonas caseinilytica TaxID=3096158 RepID=UPI002FC670FD